MRVLITGVAGFVGRHLVDHLLARGEDEVWGLARSAASAASLDERVRVLEADLQDRDAVTRALEMARPDAIYHLASQASVAKSLADPLPTIMNNVVGQVHLLEATAAIVPEARVLTVGSNEQYGLTREDELPIVETREFRPISPYAVSKVTQDLLGHQYFATKGLEVIRVRPFTHTGPRQASLFVTPSFARQLAEMEAGLREPVMRVGFLDGQRDFTDVRDVVRGYELLLRRGAPGEAYNLGSGVPRSVRSILDTLIAMSSATPNVETDPALIRPLEVPVQYADCSKLRAATGWTPEIPFEQTLADILADWRARVREGRAWTWHVAACYTLPERPVSPSQEVRRWTSSPRSSGAGVARRPTTPSASGTGPPASCRGSAAGTASSTGIFRPSRGSPAPAPTSPTVRSTTTSNAARAGARR